MTFCIVQSLRCVKRHSNIPETSAEMCMIKIFMEVDGEVDEKEDSSERCLK